jgi:DNA end-binding protein Ku
MRKKRYVGALGTVDGYLALVTLRRADQILTVEDVHTPKNRQPEAREVDLAKQLVATISGDFEPQAWKDQYRERVRVLIEAKARGEKVPARPAPRKAAAGSLAEQLRRSIGAGKERKVA